jgi:hypothetical protein
MEKVTVEKIKERIKENLSRAKSNATPIMISNAEPTQKKLVMPDTILLQRMRPPLFCTAK